MALEFFAYKSIKDAVHLRELGDLNSSLRGTEA
jgi:hypothetical protein